MAIQLRRSRSPFEIGLLVMFVVLSVVGVLFFDYAATNTVRALGPVLGRLLYIGTAIAAGVALVGVFRRGVPGLVVERIGLASLACWTVANGIAVFIAAGRHGIQFGGNMLAITLMCAFRAAQIGPEARQLASLLHLSAGESSEGEHE